MTAEEILNDKFEGTSIWGDLYKNKGDVFYEDDVILAMKEYTRIKCKELLEIVVEKAKIKISRHCFELSEEVDKDSILSAVDLDKFII